MIGSRPRGVVTLPRRRLPSHTTVVTPRKIHKHPVATKSHVDIDYTYFIGKSITLFTGFYCFLNYMFYRDLNKMYEDDDDNKQN